MTGLDADPVPPGVDPMATDDHVSSVLSSIPGIVYRRECRAPWTMCFVSEYVEVVTGVAHGAFADDCGAAFDALVHPDDVHHVADTIAADLARDGRFLVEYRVLHADGTTRWVSETGRVVTDASGRPAWIDGVILDTTERKQAEWARLRAESQLRSVVADVPGVVYRSECREPWTMLFVSDYVETLAGHPPSAFLEGGGMDFAQLLHPDDRQLIDETMADVLAHGTSYSVDYRLIHADGEVRRVSEHGRVIRDSNGSPVWLDGIILDTTLQKQAEDERDLAEARLRHQALHDDLTGLPNRTLVLDRAEQMLLRCQRGSALPTAMFIDLDEFKGVNDSLGHQAGDELLQAVAARLSHALRAEETIGRFGGDEFVILTEVGSDDPRPERIADRLLEVLSDPFVLDRYLETPLRISASIGIATGNRASAQELLRDADIALYRAKAHGKHCHIEFEPQMRIDVVDRLGLEIDLRSALDRREFYLVYQPVLDLKDGHVCSVEALLRWRHPVRGIVGPTDFVPMLEQTGMIIPVGKWVLGEACREAAVWRDEGHNTGVAVNVSVRQLEAAGFVDDVRRALQESTLDPGLLTLEVTESTLMLDTDMVVERLGLLKEVGVRIAIDDFGTGYSSLAYLQQFPVDTLKIDQSFVAALNDSTESLAFITTFVELGQILGLDTLAEGIETTGHLETLQGINCGQGQGFLISDPVAAPGIRTYLLEAARDRPEVEAPSGRVV